MIKECIAVSRSEGKKLFDGSTKLSPKIHPKKSKSSLTMKHLPVANT